MRRIEDRVAIEELLARYGNACDDRDMAALADCFARDFEFDSVAGHSVGREAAMAYYGERLGSYGVTVHVPHTLVLEELEADSATRIVSSHAEMEIEQEMFVTAFRYRDQYVRDEGTVAVPVRDRCRPSTRCRCASWPGGSTRCGSGGPAPPRRRRRCRSSCRAGPSSGAWRPGSDPPRPRAGPVPAPA